MKKKRKVVWVGGMPITPITPQERRRISEHIKKRHARLRKRYPEIHNKVVDFISHGVDDGLCISASASGTRRNSPSATPPTCSWSGRTSATSAPATTT